MICSGCYGTRVIDCSKCVEGKIICITCHGSADCERCKGKGTIGGGGCEGIKQCPDCNGTGNCQNSQCSGGKVGCNVPDCKNGKRPCPKCDGTGNV